MKIKYSYSDVGTTCDHCGRYIKHIYMIEDNGVKMNVGCKCINKICNISDYGLKTMNKDLNLIQGQIDKLNILLTRDYDMIKDKLSDGSYGMIEMTEKEKQDCNYEMTWRERSRDEYIEMIERQIEMTPMRIERMTEKLNKQLKPVKIKH